MEPNQQVQAKDILDQTTTTANSVISFDENQRAIVELDPDHPGFRDLQYRERRNQIAQIAFDFIPGNPVPVAPYTDEENQAWVEIMGHLQPLHETHAIKRLVQAGKALDLPTDRIPQLHEVNDKLSKLTGFRLEPAGGLVTPKVFLTRLGQGTFMSTQYIRHSSSPLYTPEPDVVHEIAGHAVTLACPEMAKLNLLLGQTAAKTRSEEELERLGRIYWFTIEFGVTMEDNEVKAYGAGLLSSAGELANIKEVELRPFDLDAIEAQDYDVTKYQPFLFCAESFEQFETAVRERLENW